MNFLRLSAEQTAVSDDNFYRRFPEIEFTQIEDDKISMKICGTISLFLRKIFIPNDWIQFTGIKDDEFSEIVYGANCGSSRQLLPQISVDRIHAD